MLAGFWQFMEEVESVKHVWVVHQVRFFTRLLETLPAKTTMASSRSTFDISTSLGPLTLMLACMVVVVRFT
ncbi:hypothetical protein HanRHA438_Chr05g0229831 [Helianthus annuus]|nr:hypothetical protein HanRHA438_Chr05g0229831 [Helianthus annuus]